MLIAKHTLARLIVTYYWAFVLCSFVLFCVEVIFFQVDGGVIAFSYYAFYLVVGGLTKHLLLNKIPSTLLALRATGALKESAVERLTTSPVTRLEKPLGHSLGILLILFMSWFYGFECGRFPEWPSGALC